MPPKQLKGDRDPPPPQKPDQFQRRIALADRNLGRAIAEYRSALEAGRKWASALGQDAVAKALLSKGRIALPESAIMQKVAGAYLKERGRDKIDDEIAITNLAYLMLRGHQLKPASRIAARLAQNDAGASPESVAHRLREKFRGADRQFYLFLAECGAQCDFFRSAADAALSELARDPSPSELAIIASSARRFSLALAAQLVERLSQAGRKIGLK